MEFDFLGEGATGTPGKADSKHNFKPFFRINQPIIQFVCIQFLFSFHETLRLISRTQS